ncbi:MAG: fructose 1,6-bisphosphatase [Flavobacteriaceae bacterium]|nr:fructose 1,6-bisphosphatase [Flavobacteriaceae bacterium]
MAKKNTTTPKSAPIDSNSKIEAIKNLIFGENIEQYDSEFDTIRKEIKAKKEFLQNYIDEVRNELMQSIDSLGTDVNIRITDLEDSLQAKTEALDEEKVSRKELGKLLKNLGEKISS